MKYIIEFKGKIYTEEDYIIHIKDSPKDFIEVVSIKELDDTDKRLHDLTNTIIVLENQSQARYYAIQQTIKDFTDKIILSLLEGKE